MKASEMWKAFCEKAKLDEKTPYEAWAFCGGGEMGDALAYLTLKGVKTGTASWQDSYEAEGEALPEAGEYSVILFDDGEAACVIRTDSVEVVPFDEVSAEHAFAEGEGDRSLAYWRQVHEEIFTEECAEDGIAFDRSHCAVLERFSVVYKPISTVTIVSLSAGVLGEKFVAHEKEIGEKRLSEMGLKVKYAPHALCGIEYIKNHPEKRAEDLLWAFEDEETDMILCAIGGEDTYRLLPYLFGNGELQRAIKKKPFLGFSDTTMNHLMLHKVGLDTFYGQSFLADLCDIGPDMPEYTRHYFEELIYRGKIREIVPSRQWFEPRSDFSVEQIGTELVAHENVGFVLLQGKPKFEGEILGGCLDSMYDIFDGTRFADSPEVCAKYGIFPDLEDWRGKILLLETSEERMSPEKFGKALGKLKDAGVFKVVSGVLVGRPVDEKYLEEYKKLLVQGINDPELPVVCNLSIGHCEPRCVLPFGVRCEVDAEKQIIKLGVRSEEYRVSTTRERGH